LTLKKLQEAMLSEVAAEFVSDELWLKKALIITA
jgi:hypothetical protein